MEPFTIKASQMKHGSAWNDASFLLHHYVSALIEDNEYNNKILEEIKKWEIQFPF